MVMIKRRNFLAALVGVILAHQLLNRKLSKRTKLITQKL